MVSPVRIAALIVAHHRPDLFSQLLDRLNTPLWQPYVCIDAKAELQKFCPATRAIFLDDRIEINWGGIGLTRAALALLRRAVEDPGNTHFYLMSGQCRLIKDDAYIANLISETKGNFFSTVQMPQPDKPFRRLERWHFYDVKPKPLRWAAWRILRHLPNRKAAKLLRGARPYGGLTWWLLSRNTVERLLRFVQDNSWYLKAFRFSEIPDEMFFQTALASLGITPDKGCPTAMKWIDGRPHPEVVTEEMLREFQSGWRFAARKFV